MKSHGEYGNKLLIHTNLLASIWYFWFIFGLSPPNSLSDALMSFFQDRNIYTKVSFYLTRIFTSGNFVPILVGKKCDHFFNFVHCVVWFLSKLVSDVSDLVCYSVTCFTCDICKPAKLNWTFVLPGLVIFCPNILILLIFHLSSSPKVPMNHLIKIQFLWNVIE